MILETHVGQPKATRLQIESQNPALQPHGNEASAGPQQNRFRARKGCGYARCERKTRTAFASPTEKSGGAAESVHPDACCFRRPTGSGDRSTYAKGERCHKP
jgi:hypothetical protein